MRIFVASWFFPPVTTSEGIVAYKLLRNSKHQYDVCSSLSRQWTYNHDFSFEADNITVYPIDTDDFTVWVDEAVRIFEEQHAKNPYDAYMTRCMPPESIWFAQRMREAHPEMPWIASLADPIAKNPYEVKGLILDSPILSQHDKDQFIWALHYGISQWRNHWNPNIRMLCEKKDLEDYVISHASAILMPHDTMRSFVLDNRQRANTFTVPHSFDRTLYPVVTQSETAGVVTLTFLGHTDELRSLEPIVRAVAHLQRTDSGALDHLHIRFIGNVPEKIRTLVFSDFLHNTISIEPGVDYLESLRIMEESDWLIHVDAKFDFLPETGGSIFFAGKLADYMGTNKPILAITGVGSPAAEITREAGGLVFDPDDIVGLAQALGDIAQGRVETQVDQDYRAKYDATVVAADYDAIIDKVVAPQQTGFVRESWPFVPPAPRGQQKLLSICVPSYKVECFLDRCLFSMISSDVANLLEILVVNDGSPDNSREIALAYQEHYSSIVHLIDKENGGHGSTINAALEVATGTYFRVVDGDDWLDSIELSKLLTTLLDNHLEPDLVSSNYYQVYAGSGDTVAWEKQGKYPYDKVIDFATADFSQEYFSIHSLMAKTAIMRNADFKIQEHTYYVDVEYMLFFIPYVKTVMFTSGYLYRYTVGNAEQSINPDVFLSRYDQHDRVIRRMVTYFTRWPDALSPGQLSYVRHIFAQYLVKTHFELSLIMDPDKVRGCARARDFDNFLKAESIWLYTMAGRLYRGVRQARRVKFNPRRVKHFRAVESGTFPPHLRSRAIKWFKRQIMKYVPLATRIVGATGVGRHFLESENAAKIRQQLR